MISVLTLTYKRTKFLEEALESYLFQEIDCQKELVIINDDKNTEYNFNRKDVTIFNLKDRFNSISSKLKWGTQKCKYNYIYRLDDDDLLTKDGLQSIYDEIKKNLGYDIYRSKFTYYFHNNEYKGKIDTINNGNLYTKEYLNRISWPDLNLDEDIDIIYNNKANIFHTEIPTMICRGGMDTFHLSYGCSVESMHRINKRHNQEFYQTPLYSNLKNEKILDFADKALSQKYNFIGGKINLRPNFKKDYYKEIK